MNVKYDPGIIQQYANRQYRLAAMIVITAVLLGGVAGFFIGSYIASQFLYEWVFSLIFAVFSSFLLAVIGFFIGRSVVFNRKVRAQAALCQVNIELNTRGEGTPFVPQTTTPPASDTAPPEKVQSMTPAARICPKCSFENKPNAKFCTSCGSSF